MICVDHFRRFMRDIKPSRYEGDGPVEKRCDQQYMQRVGMVELLRLALLMNSGLTTTQQLKVADRLSAPEVFSQPQRWAERFECMAEEERGSEPLQQVWALASDVCALVRVGEMAGDHATATDGNGDVSFDEDAAA